MKSKFDISSKVVVVTGGAGLLGEAFGRAICLSGATLIIGEKEISASQAARKKILTDNPEAIIKAIELDITNENSIRRALEDSVGEFERIDALVNNAYPRNKNYGKDFFNTSYYDFCENVSMNLGGYFVTSKIFAEFFKNCGGGNIVNISSIYGVVSPRFEIYEGTEMTMPVEYCVIKSGLIHLTRYMAKYFKGENIRVNSLSPGGVLDQQDPIFIDRYKEQCLVKGMLDKSDLAGGLLFLLSDASLYMNGQNLIIDDGFTA